MLNCHTGTDIERQDLTCLHIGFQARRHKHHTANRQHAICRRLDIITRAGSRLPQRQVNILILPLAYHFKTS